MDELDRNLMDLRSALRQRRERNDLLLAQTPPDLATSAEGAVAPSSALLAPSDSEPTDAAPGPARGWWSRFFGT